MFKKLAILTLIILFTGCATTQQKTLSPEDLMKLAQITMDSKVTALPEDESPDAADIGYIIVDTGGTPTSKKAEWGNIITKAHGLGAWKFLYTDASGYIASLALGADNTLPFSIGPSGMPEWRAILYSDITTFTEANLYTLLTDVNLFLEDLVDDATPTLGGNLNLNEKYITEDEAEITTGTTPDLSGLGTHIKMNYSSEETVTGFSNITADTEYVFVFTNGKATIDFSGTNLYGHDGNDWDPETGDSMKCTTIDTTNMYCRVSRPSVLSISQFYQIPFNPYLMSDHSWRGSTQPGRAGEALNFGEIIACRKEGTGKPCYWYKYSAATGDGDKDTWPTGIATETITIAATSGLLVVGEVYILTDWITADDFINVGAASNADGIIFTATGTTPTTWTNSSVVNQLGDVGSGHGYARDDTWVFTANQDEGKFVFASDTTDGGILLTQPTDTGDMICPLGKILDASGYVGDIVEFNFTGHCAEE